MVRIIISEQNDVVILKKTNLHSKPLLGCASATDSLHSIRAVWIM